MLKYLQGSDISVERDPSVHNLYDTIIGPIYYF